MATQSLLQRIKKSLLDKNSTFNKVIKTPQTLQNKAAGLAKSMFLEAPARATTTLLQGTKNSAFKPTTKTEKFFLGKESIPSVSRYLEEAPKRYAQYGVSQKTATKIAPYSLVAGVGMSLLPQAGESKILKSARLISGTEDIGKIGRELKGLGFAEKNVSRLSKVFQKEKNASKILESLKAEMGVAKIPSSSSSLAPYKSLSQDLEKMRPTKELPQSLQKDVLFQQGLKGTKQSGLSQLPKTNLAKNNVSSYAATIAGKPPFYNTKNLNIDKKAKELVTQTISDIKPQIEKVVGKTLSHKEVLKEARFTNNEMQKVIGRDATLELGAQQIKLRQKISSVAEKGMVTQEFMDDLLKDKAFGANAARLLEQRRIAADPKVQNNMEQIIGNLLKQGEDSDKLLKAAKGVDFNDTKQATEFYRRYVKPKLGDWLDRLRYNSMLSSPTTHIVNTFVNATQSIVTAPLEKLTLGGIDWLSSALRNKPRKYLAGESGAYLKGYIQGVSPGIKKFTEVIKGVGVDTPEVKHMALTTKGAANIGEQFLTFPNRLLEAMDQLFLVPTKAGESAGIAYRAKRGLSVTGDIEQKAMREAMNRLFRGELGGKDQGALLQLIDYIPNVLFQARESDNFLIKNIAKWTIPFVKTPTNILKQGIEYSPLGFATLVGNADKQKQLAKALMGSLVAGVGGATLLSSNRLTWAEPTEDKKKDAFKSAGMLPYSVKIGDKWFSYAKLPPLLGTNLALLAAVDDSVKNRKLDSGTAENIIETLGKWSNSFFDQSYMKSIGDLVSGVKGAKIDIARITSNYAQQVIPMRAFMGWINRIVDPVQRKADPDGTLLEKQMQYLMMQIPGLSKKVPARINPVTGEEMKIPSSLGNAFSPIRYSQADQQGEQLYQGLQQATKLNQIQSRLKDERNQRIQDIISQVDAQSTPEARDQLFEQLTQNDLDLAKDIISAKRIQLRDKQITQSDLSFVRVLPSITSTEGKAKYLITELDKKYGDNIEHKNQVLMQLYSDRIISKNVLITLTQLVQKGYKGEEVPQPQSFLQNLLSTATASAAGLEGASTNEPTPYQSTGTFTPQQDEILRKFIATRQTKAGSRKRSGRVLSRIKSSKIKSVKVKALKVSKLPSSLKSKNSVGVKVKMPKFKNLPKVKTPKAKIKKFKIKT